jgi:hypothetical protein
LALEALVVHILGMVGLEITLFFQQSLLLEVDMGVLVLAPQEMAVLVALAVAALPMAQALALEALAHLVKAMRVAQVEWALPTLLEAGEVLAQLALQVTVNLVLAVLG